MKTQHKHDKHNRIKEQRLTLTREEMDILKMIRPLISATEERLKREGMERTKAVLNVVSPHRLVGRIELKIYVELPVHDEDHVSM